MLKKYGLIVFLWGVSHVAAAEPLNVMLDWLPNPDQAPLFVAESAGFFAKHGVKVVLVNPSDASDPAKMVAVGQMDIALTYQPSWLMRQAQGLPLVWLGNLIDRPLACVIADGSQGIQQLTDLKQRTIGYSSGEVDSLVLGRMLSWHGLPLKSVTLLNVHYNLNQALLTHRVAAVSGAMRNVELIELTALGFNAVAFYPEQNGVPPYAELIFVTTAAKAKTPPLQAFMAAISDAIAYTKAHPDLAWQAVIAHYPALNTPMNAKIFQATLPYFADHPRAFDSAQNERLKQFLLSA